MMTEPTRQREPTTAEIESWRDDSQIWNDPLARADFCNRLIAKFDRLSADLQPAEQQDSLRAAEVARVREELLEAEVRGYALWLHTDRHAQPKCALCRRFNEYIVPTAEGARAALEGRSDE